MNAQTMNKIPHLILISMNPARLDERRKNQ